MSQLASVTIKRGRALKSELGAAWITQSSNLSAPGLLANNAGVTSFLPAYKSAAQQAGGHEAFATSIADDGTLSIFLQAAAPADVPSGAQPMLEGATYNLVLDASGAGVRFPLQADPTGTSVALKATFAGADLARVRAALFDANPNVAVEVSQPVLLAVRQSREFIDANWSNAAIQNGLLDLFGGIPNDSAAEYYDMASGADANFPTQYLLLSCQFKTAVGVPPLPGYIQWQIGWNGRAYNYYQDNREPSHIFYVPDRFELATGPQGAPTVSLLQFTMPEGASSESDLRATFRYFGNPVVEPARIEAATLYLREQTRGPVQLMSIEDGHDVKKTFTQYLPNAQASGESGSPQVQAKASINCVTGLRNELDLNLAQFRALWAAIGSKAPEKTLFRGWVDLSIADGRYADRIEFNGRLTSATPESFLDDILDVSSSNTYPASINIIAIPKVFTEPPSILQIGLTFSGKKQVKLDKQTTSIDVTIERPVRDIILGNQPPDQYPYRMRVVGDDGTIRYGDFSADGAEDLVINQKRIDACKEAS